MKTKTRILSALLTVFLLLSALATGIVAAETTVEEAGILQKLGWKNVKTGSYPGVWGNNYSGKIVKSNDLKENNHSLFVETVGSNWMQAELVSADKMAGVTKYTMSMTTKLITSDNITWHDILDFRFGARNADTALGDWVGVRWVSGGENVNFENRGYEYEGSTNVTGKASFADAVISFSVKVDTEAKTIDVFKNDEAKTLIAHRENCSAVVGPIYLAMGRCLGWIDDIRVTNDANGDVIYSEDFESLSLRGNVEYEGVQESAVKDGTYAVRFVGALGDDVALENYTEVGFKVTATWGADGTKTLDTACTTVYGKITGSADGVTSEYRADSFGAKYLFALAVEGIPTDAGQITFTVTPYYVTAAGTVTGNACTVIYNAGALVSQTAN